MRKSPIANAVGLFLLVQAIDGLSASVATEEV